MALNKQPYRGTRDFFPKDKRVRDYLFAVMTKTAESFGYESYDGPLLEEVELYKAKSGEELINEQIYSFTDRGERFVAIRPEMTPTLARMVAQIHRESSKPLRWFSIPNLMRYEKPQRGRVREHWQLNCDVFGCPGRLGEVEILQVAVELFQSYGANSTHFEILLNDRAIADAVFKTMMKATSEQTHRLYKIVDKAKKITHEALQKMFGEVGLDSVAENIFYSYLQLKTFDEVKIFLEKNEQNEIAELFSIFVEFTKKAGLSEYLKYDPTIVRGLDYYTGIVFEIFDKHPDNRRALCGGGAYANLLQIFNEEPLPGVGFGLGDVTLRDFLEVHKLLPNLDIPVNDVFVTFQEDDCLDAALKLAQLLRKNNLKIVTSLEPLKFKKVFPTAEKKGVKFVTLMGSDELAKNQIQLKNLASKEQHTLNLSDVEEILKIIKA
ncbi:MAG: histidine--tRNA ligase [Bacteriovorax sp.]|nr:histidine--tRNA ligase [Bacteriovorax sp.]